MPSTDQFIHLPYTPDLTEGGIAYAVRALPHAYQRLGGSPYERLRRSVAGAAVELAFRRYLSEQGIPFDVIGAAPFREPDHYDVALAGWRCDMQSYLITRREQISAMRSNPQILLRAPALVASDENAAQGHLNSDIYIFAFVAGLVTASAEDWQKVLQANKPHHLLHMMPEAWRRPAQWNPLGRLVLKSESQASQRLEIGGQDAGREMRSITVEVPPGMRIQVDTELYSLAYVHATNLPEGRIGIHSGAHKETHIIAEADWGNIWVYGKDILLTGYLTREEFNRRASFVREGARVFQYDKTRTKNLAVSVLDLKPLTDLFERVRHASR